MANLMTSEENLPPRDLTTDQQQQVPIYNPKKKWKEEATWYCGNREEISSFDVKAKKRRPGVYNRGPALSLPPTRLFKDKEGGQKQLERKSEVDQVLHVNSNGLISQGEAILQSRARRVCGSKDWIFPGSTVLSRWKNGLYFLGLILKVDELANHALVRYEDGTTHWTDFKDIHKQLSHGTIMADSDILCVTCGSGISESPDEIVICDVCNQGYHQLCHRPEILDIVLEPNVPWSCRLCIFALGAREGGAEKLKTKVGEKLRRMKTCFAYDLDSLQWDDLHRTNHQNTYCYCGGPGEFSSKMLQCGKCHQWFHEGCVQCLEQPLLYGDHYFNFSCSVCNKGPETLQRIIMKWSDVLAMVLHNLVLEQGRKFYELQGEIVPFLQRTCHRMKLSEDIGKLSTVELAEKVSLVFKANPLRFGSGKGARRKPNSWALRSLKGQHLFAPPHSSVMCHTASNILCLDISSLGDEDAPSLNEKNEKVKVPKAHSSGQGSVSKSKVSKSSFGLMKPEIAVKLGRSTSLISLDNSIGATSMSVGAIDECVSTVLERGIELEANESESSSASLDVTGNSDSVSCSSTLVKSEKSLDGDDSLVFPKLLSLDVAIPFPVGGFEGKNNPFYEEPEPNELDMDTSLCVEGEPDKANRSGEDCIMKASADSPSKTTIKIGNTSPATKEPRSHDSSPNVPAFKAPIEEDFEGDTHTVATTTGDSQLDSLGHNSEKFKVLARRVDDKGKVEYLLEWDTAAKGFCN